MGSSKFDYCMRVYWKYMLIHASQIAGGFLFASAVPNWYLLFLILALSSGWKLRMPTGDLGAAKHAHSA
jgi:hypothetical protein